MSPRNNLPFRFQTSSQMSSLVALDEPVTSSLELSSPSNTFQGLKVFGWIATMKIKFSTANELMAGIVLIFFAGKVFVFLDGFCNSLAFSGVVSFCFVYGMFLSCWCLFCCWDDAAVDVLTVYLVYDMMVF
ncbi:unnamed protein product [Vicia faba]|uniref:Transmembrane protein n=1 Tax=Vicia faba TaxID=3906 RepID=A0AAV0Z6L1_VICFA|nr:unnamed protein product [Vicia faba]